MYILFNIIRKNKQHRLISILISNTLYKTANYTDYNIQYAIFTSKPDTFAYNREFLGNNPLYNKL